MWGLISQDFNPCRDVACRVCFYCGVPRLFLLWRAASISVAVCHTRFYIVYRVHFYYCMFQLTNSKISKGIKKRRKVHQPINYTINYKTVNDRIHL